jgi:hypothetical protein
MGCRTWVGFHAAARASSRRAVQVEGSLAYLLRKRPEDPYGDFAKRLAFEASWGWRRQAPTFTP